MIEYTVICDFCNRRISTGRFSASFARRAAIARGKMVRHKGWDLRDQCRLAGRSGTTPAVGPETREGG